MARHAAFITYRVMGGKEGSANRIWPIAGEKKTENVTRVWGETKEEAIENYKKIMAIHNIPIKDVSKN